MTGEMTMRLTLVALALAATPALGLEIDNMTEAERAAFRAEVRAYLMDNPEVLMEAIGVLEQRQAEEEAQADGQLVAQNRAALFEDGHSWVGGNPEGDITVVEFLDYRCGYCKRAHPEVADLIASDGEIRYIIKEFPILGAQSVLASRFALAVQTVAGDAAYKTVSDALMAQQADVTEASLTELANTLGLDTDAIMEKMSSDAVDSVLQSNRMLAQRMQITGTPTFVFEDQMVRGFAPLDAMKQIVEEVRADS
jgi:protein-disulfide isomerase